MQVSLARHHGAMLLKYSGISFISDAVNHGFFSGERSLWTAAVGVALFLLGAFLAHRLSDGRQAEAGDQANSNSPGTPSSLTRTLLLGALLSIGLGFFTGGLQHFPDSPQRSAWVVPLGFFISIAALVYELDLRWRPKHSAYTLMVGSFITLASVGAWRWFEANPSWMGDHAHHHASAAGGEVHGAAGHQHQTDAHDDHKLQDATESGLLAMTVDRTIAIRMDDKMRFYPDRFDVKAGETVKLLVSNEGSLPHELVLGSDKEITEHATEMKKHRGHHHHHAHDSKTEAISLEPGKESMLIVRFEKAGQLQMDCLVPGHYEAGMRGLVTVGQRS